jgi:RecA/RadA recombinase
MALIPRADSQDVEKTAADAEKKRRLNEAVRKAQDAKAIKNLAERKKGVDIVVDKMQKDYGKGALTLMSDHALDIPRISTGLLSMDVHTGGGVPKGRITEFFGPEESGKTTRMAATIAQAQRTCVHCGKRGRFIVYGTVKVPLPGDMSLEVPNHVLVECPCGNPRQFMAAHFDIEGSYDPVWFMAQGVWLEHCFLSRPIVLEEAVDVVQGVLESGKFDMVSFDSVAQGTSKQEVEKSAADATVGLAARLYNSAMRRWQVMQNQTYRRAFDKGDMVAVNCIPTILLINQVRMKVGGYGNPETTPGGNGIRFSASLRIRFQGAEAAKEGGGDASKGISVGEKQTGGYLKTHVMKFKIAKSKVSPKGYGGEYLLVQEDTPFYRLGEIDQSNDLVEFGLKSGVIYGEPNSYRIEGVVEDPKNVSKKELDKLEGVLPLKRFRGKSEMELFMSENRDEARRIYDLIVFKMTGTSYDGTLGGPVPSNVVEDDVESDGDEDEEKDEASDDE